MSNFLDQLDEYESDPKISKSSQSQAGPEISLSINTNSQFYSANQPNNSVDSSNPPKKSSFSATESSSFVPFNQSGPTTAQKESSSLTVASLDAILDACRMEYDKKIKKEKINNDHFIALIAQRYFYRFALISHSRLNNNSNDSTAALMKDMIRTLIILMETRQAVMDLFEYEKNQGTKSASIMTSHKWLVVCSSDLEQVYTTISLRVAQVNAKLNENSLQLPASINSSLYVLEDRLSFFTSNKAETLFTACPDIKGLRAQMENLYRRAYDPIALTLLTAETLGKSLTNIILLKTELRHTFSMPIQDSFATARGVSLALLHSLYSIDFSTTTAARLTASTTRATSKSIAPLVVPNSNDEFYGGASQSTSSVVDVMRSATPSNNRLLLPDADCVKYMSEGAIFVGYFCIPGTNDVIKSPIQLWYDTIDESVGPSAAGFEHLRPSKVSTTLAPPTPSVENRRFTLSGVVGSGRGAIYWCGEKDNRTRNIECCMPLSDLSDILTGKQTKILKSTTAADAHPGCCLTLVTKSGLHLNFEASSPTLLSTWVSGLTRLVTAAGKKLYEENVISVAPKHYNYPLSPKGPRVTSETTTNPAPNNNQAPTAPSLTNPVTAPIPNPPAAPALSVPTVSSDTNKVAGRKGSLPPPLPDFASLPPLSPLASPEVAPPLPPFYKQNTLKTQLAPAAAPAPPAPAPSPAPVVNEPAITLQLPNSGPGQATTNSQSNSMNQGNTNYESRTKFVNASESTEPNSEASNFQEPEMRNGWVLLYTPEGYPFYHNPEKQLTVWEKPPEY